MTAFSEDWTVRKKHGSNRVGNNLFLFKKRECAVLFISSIICVFSKASDPCHDWIKIFGFKYYVISFIKIFALIRIQDIFYLLIMFYILATCLGAVNWNFKEKHDFDQWKRIRFTSRQGFPKGYISGFFFTHFVIPYTGGFSVYMGFVISRLHCTASLSHH